MARGNLAKEQVTKTIIDAFGNSFITVADKKIYVWSEENGEKVQVAISLTCPKTPVAIAENISTNGLEVTTENDTPAQVNISPEDQEQINRLKEMLGITKK